MGRWITKGGKHIYLPDEDESTSTTSKHSGDTITRQMALDSWAKNASGIKAASKGEKYDGNLFGKVALNDEAKAEQIINFVNGSKVNDTIYRGIENLDEDTYKQYTTIGSEVDEKGLSSWSLNKGTASGSGRIGRGITFIKEGSTENARKLGNRTGTGIENEVIVYNHKAKVVKVEKDKYTTWVWLKKGN